ncbi:uncharacterized protein G2W53_007296 [Senna tora]|uniref:Uncharacterized protein n=1 Tax=Senna tora TaxID=362788 RepID=A0A835CE28_9FABA|nr:uncharacterized protein G2W53_007296 [Senna tora]
MSRKVFIRESDLREGLTRPWLLGLVLQPHDRPDLPFPSVGVCLGAPHYSSRYDVYGLSHCVHVVLSVPLIIAPMGVYELNLGPNDRGGFCLRSLRLRSSLRSSFLSSLRYPSLMLLEGSASSFLDCPPSLACCTSSNAMYLVDLASNSAMVFGGFLVMEQQNNLLRRGVKSVDCEEELDSPDLDSDKLLSDFSPLPRHLLDLLFREPNVTSSLGSGGKFTDPCSGVPPVPASRAFSCAALRAFSASNKAVVRSTEGPSAVPPSAL